MRLTQAARHQDDNFEPRITQLIEDNMQVFSKLSPRERDVLKYSLLGFEEKDIAAKLGVSISTVVTHRRRFYGKLNIGSKAELFQRALMLQM